MSEIRLGVLVSGSGTILESILDHQIPVEIVVSDRACRALDVATEFGVTARLIDRRQYSPTATFDRERFTGALIDQLVESRIDLVAMAGFGTIVTGGIYERFADRILNTHPSLLPLFKGWHAVRDALEAGATVTGCTVHLSRLELDDGPVLAQTEVAVKPEDSEITLHERIKEVERELYPRVIIAAMAALTRNESLSSLRIN